MTHHVSQIKKDIGYGCGEAAASTVNMMRILDMQWTPGKDNGYEVNVPYLLPVKFRLP